MVRGVGGVYDMCMCLVRGGVGVSELSMGFTILWEQGECWTCVCVLVAVV